LPEIQCNNLEDVFLDIHCKKIKENLEMNKLPG